MSKQELADLYSISVATLRKLLNCKYFEILEKLGYGKNDHILSPAIVREFMELYGQPLNKLEYE